MDKLHAYRQAFAHLPEGCTAAEVNLICKENTQISCAAGEMKGCTTSERNMLFVRATGKATGIVYCENLDKDPLELIRMALENASVVEAAQPQPMLENHHDAHVCESAHAVTAQELIAKAREWSLLPGVLHCSITQCIRHSLVLNSLGTETAQCQPIYTVSLGVPGKGEDNFKSKECSAQSLDAIDVEKMMRELEAESVLDHAELPFVKLPSGAYDAVISSAVMTNIMNTAWQLFSQRLIDANRTPLRVGDKLGTDKLQIIDCPTSPWSGYDFTIDGEGVRGPAKNLLVSDGVIVSSLRTLKHGESTGSAERADLLSGNINTELIPVPRNIWVQPGEKSPEELIAQMGTGIHLTYSMDEYHSLNIASATFSIPCGGVYYENGKAVGRLQQMNLCGSFKELFAGLEDVADDMTMRAMWPHYDYCFGGPSLLVRSAQFAM